MSDLPVPSGQNYFLLEKTINDSGTVTALLSTQNKFLDKNIAVKINTPAASGFSLDINNNTTDNVTVGNLNTTTNKYPVTATVGGTLSASTAGWFSSGNGSESGVTVGVIPKATFTISDNKFYCNSPGYITAGSAANYIDSITSVTPTASIDTGTSNNYNGLTTYFTKLNNSTGADVTIKPQYSTLDGYVSSATNSITSDNITYWSIKTATPTFDGGAVSGTATAEGTNATLSEGTNTSGIIITTGGTANRADVLYNGVVNGWVTKNDNTVALAAPGTAATLTSKTYYINAVTVPANKTFNVTNNAGTTVITSASTSTGTITIKAKVDATDANTTNADVVVNGKWHVNDVEAGTNITGPYYGLTNVAAVTSTYFSASNIKDGVTITVKSGTTTLYTATGTFTHDGDITAADVATGKIAYSKGQRIVGNMPSNGSLNATITTQGGTYTIPGGHTSGGTITAQIDATTITVPTWTKNGTTHVATMGNYSWTDGFISASSISAASFGNSPASGKTSNSYLDLSDALISAGGSFVIPEIDQDGYLYINKGYIDDVRILLGRLIPGAEPANGATTSAQILQGYTAYDKDGNLLTGSIVTKTSSNISFNTTTGVITVPTGYYAADATYTIGVSTITPNYNFPGSGDSDLDNYLEQLSSATGSQVSINKTYSTNQAGYVGAHTNTNAGTIYYKLKSPTFESAGGSSLLVADSTNTSSQRSIYTAAADTFISIDSSAPNFSTTGKVYIKVSSSDQIKTTSTGRGALTSGVTIATAGTHTSYVGIDLYTGAYEYVSSLSS